MFQSNLYSSYSSSVGAESCAKQNVFKDLKAKQFTLSDSHKPFCFTDCNSSSFKDFKIGCVLSCCCSYCTFTPASTKERIKSSSVTEQNKACQRCMLCKSMSFCPSCSQCPQCCHRTECRGQVTKVLAYLASNECTSSGGVCPVLTRSPLFQSGYTNPVKNRLLKEALLNLMKKLVVEKVVVKSSRAFYNQLLIVPKPNRKWRPILDLSQLNLYLSTNTFKMETIRWLSLQTGEWITSLDFSDVYFHIPINERSRKYLRFFLFNQTF